MNVSGGGGEGARLGHVYWDTSPAASILHEVKQVARLREVGFVWSPHFSLLCGLLSWGPACQPSSPASLTVRAITPSRSPRVSPKAASPRPSPERESAEAGRVAVFMGEFLLSARRNRGRKGHWSWAQRGHGMWAGPHLTIAESLDQPGLRASPRWGTAARAENQISSEELREVTKPMSSKSSEDCGQAPPRACPQALSSSPARSGDSMRGQHLSVQPWPQGHPQRDEALGMGGCPPLQVCIATSAEILGR